MATASTNPARQVIVFDTNVLIPLCIPASRATRLFSRLQDVNWIVAASVAILDEDAAKMRTKENLRRWLQLSEHEINDFLTSLPLLLRVVPGAVAADPKDDKIIAAAIEAGASYIVSQDRHLQDLRNYRAIVIMSMEQFSAELDGLGVP